jgi:hypothetical protein
MASREAFESKIVVNVLADPAYHIVRDRFEEICGHRSLHGYPSVIANNLKCAKLRATASRKLCIDSLNDFVVAHGDSRTVSDWSMVHSSLSGEAARGNTRANGAP